MMLSLAIFIPRIDWLRTSLLISKINWVCTLLLKSPQLVLPKEGKEKINCNWKGSGSFVSKPLTTLADPFSSKTFGNSAAKNERHLFTLQFDNAGV